MDKMNFTKEEFIAEIRKAVEVEVEEIKEAILASDFREMADTAIKMQSILSGEDMGESLDELVDRASEESSRDVREAGEILISNVTQIFDLDKTDKLPLYVFAAIKKDAVASFIADMDKDDDKDIDDMDALSSTLKTIAIEYRILQRMAEGNTHRSEYAAKLAEALEANSLELIELATKLKKAVAVKRMIDSLENKYVKSGTKQGYKTKVDATESVYKN